MPPVLLDTDTLSEVIKRRDFAIQRQAQEYLNQYHQFQFSVITRYEILRGLKAKDAFSQVMAFERQCQKSLVFPLNDEIVVKAADIYGFLHKRGGIIGDADILIAATALVHGLTLITNNLDHFRRIPDLRSESWRSPEPS